MTIVPAPVLGPNIGGKDGDSKVHTPSIVSKPPKLSKEEENADTLPPEAEVPLHARLFVIVTAGEKVNVDTATGALGRIGLNNAYMSAYPSYNPIQSKKPRDLALGERISGVVFSLSGGSGIYDIVRVK